MTTALTFAANMGGLIVQIVISLALFLVAAVGTFKAFEKAGKPGWAGFVPIYNVIVMLEIAGKPVWWILLLLVPCVNIIIAIILFVAIAEAYGKGAGFGIGLLFLGFIFWPILGFGDAKYIGPRSPQR